MIEVDHKKRLIGKKRYVKSVIPIMKRDDIQKNQKYCFFNRDVAENLTTRTWVNRVNYPGDEKWKGARSSLPLFILRLMNDQRFFL
jgi:hypothetical protein